MEPSYYRSLEAARNCNEKDIESINNLILDIKDDNLKEDLKRLKDFISYANSKDDKKYYISNKYLNALELLNMGENSISQLLAWLLDSYWIKENTTPANKLPEKFCYKFLEILKNKTKDEKILRVFKEKTLEELSKHVHCSQDYHNFDILFEVRDADETEILFVCVIENKKNANICCTKVKTSNNKYITQLEKYYKSLDSEKSPTDNKPYKDKPNLFIFLCAELDILLKPIKDHASCSGGTKFDISNLYVNDQKIDDKKTINELLDNFGYIPLEHSEIVLLLYKILKNDESYEEYFANNSTIMPANFDKTINIIQELQLAMNENNSKKCIRKVFGNTKNNGIIKSYATENYLTYGSNILDGILQNSKEYEEYFLDIPNKKERKIKGSLKIQFYNYLSELKGGDKSIIELLFRYIEYWELHCDIGGKKDWLEGYTKIFDGKYFYQVCKNLYENPKISNKLANNVQQIIKEKMMSDIFNNIQEVIKDILKQKITFIGNEEEKSDCIFLLFNNYKKYFEYKNCGYTICYKREEDKFVIMVEEKNASYELMNGSNYLLLKNNNKECIESIKENLKTIFKYSYA